MRVVGIGDNVVDHYINTGIMYPGGNALNFSVLARILGIDSSYIGVFGNDRAGLHIHRVLHEIGVDISHCRIEVGENGISAINHKDGDRNIEEVNSGGVLKKYPIVLTPKILDYLCNFDVIHTSIYSGLESQISSLRNLRASISFDFSDLWDDDYLINVCPNIDVALVSCGEMNSNEVDKLAQRVLSLGSKLFIGTLGASGVLVTDGLHKCVKKPYNISSFVMDTLGAGDAFITGFLIQYAQGLKYLTDLSKRSNAILDCGDLQDYKLGLIKQSMSLGNALASFVCQENGAFGYGIPINQ